MKIPQWSHMIIMFCVALILYSIGLGWGLPSEFSPAVDVDFPIGPLAFIGQYSDPTSTSTYPAFHYLLTLPFYAIVIFISKITGNFSSVSSAWPYGFLNPVLWFGIMLMVSRIISMIMGIGILFLIWQIRPFHSNKIEQLLGILFLGLSGPFTYYVREANLDIPYSFWWTLALFFTWRIFWGKSSKNDLIWVGVFSALAIATKDQVVGLVTGLGLIFLVLDTPFGVAGMRQRLINTLYFGVTLVVVYSFVAIAPQPFRWLHHLTVWTLNSPRVADFVEFEPSLRGQFGLFYKTIVHLNNLISPIGIFLLILGVIRLVKHKNWQWLIVIFLPIFTYYFVVIVNIRYVYERFLIPVSISLIPLIGVGIDSVLRSSKKLHGLFGIMMVIFAISYQVLFGYLPVTYMQVVDIKKQLTITLAYTIPSGSNIIWDDGRIADLPNADVYTNYKLIMPMGKKSPLRSVEHILSPYDPNVHCLLSTNMINQSNNDITLIASLNYPSWVTNHVMEHVLVSYYLYDIDGKCAHDPN